MRLGSAAFLAVRFCCCDHCRIRVHIHSHRFIAPRPEAPKTAALLISTRNLAPTDQTSLKHLTIFRNSKLLLPYDAFTSIALAWHRVQQYWYVL